MEIRRKTLIVVLTISVAILAVPVLAMFYSYSNIKQELQVINEKDLLLVSNLFTNTAMNIPADNILERNKLIDRTKMINNNLFASDVRKYYDLLQIENEYENAYIKKLDIDIEYQSKSKEYEANLSFYKGIGAPSGLFDSIKAMSALVKLADKSIQTEKNILDMLKKWKEEEVILSKKYISVLPKRNLISKLDIEISNQNRLIANKQKVTDNIHAVWNNFKGEVSKINNPFYNSLME